VSNIFLFVAWFADDVESTEGFVTFSLTNGPEYHVSQVYQLTIPIS